MMMGEFGPFKSLALFNIKDFNLSCLLTQDFFLQSIRQEKPKSYNL